MAAVLAAVVTHHSDDGDDVHYSRGGLRMALFPFLVSPMPHGDERVT